MNVATILSIHQRWLAGLALLLPLAGCEMPAGSTQARPTTNQRSEYKEHKGHREYSQRNARDERNENEDTWAIRCLTLRGPNRHKLADSYSRALKAVAGIKPELVQVFHEAEQANLYYGRYRRIYNAARDSESFTPDHLRDLNLIRQLSMTVQDPAAGARAVWPFRLATMETLPVGRGRHPEWLLSIAPGYYSLQVAVFYNTEGMRQRKFAAEEYCKLLREQDEEAYYHHGAVNSSVCIGAFPEEAIQTFQDQDPLSGIIHVTSKIVDERMLTLQRRFPHNLHNGRTFYEVTRDPRTGKKLRDPHTSFAVEIPRREQGASFFSP